jgi:hypothetical protein
MPTTQQPNTPPPDDLVTMIGTNQEAHALSQRWEIAKSELHALVICGAAENMEDVRDMVRNSSIHDIQQFGDDFSKLAKDLKKLQELSTFPVRFKIEPTQSENQTMTLSSNYKLNLSNEFPGVIMFEALNRFFPLEKDQTTPRVGKLLTITSTYLAELNEYMIRLQFTTTERKMSQQDEIELQFKTTSCTLAFYGKIHVMRAIRKTQNYISSLLDFLTLPQEKEYDYGNPIMGQMNFFTALPNPTSAGSDSAATCAPTMTPR